MDLFPEAALPFLRPTPTATASGTAAAIPDFHDWLPRISPELSWHWRHLKFVRHHLRDVTERRIDRLAISWPPQHAKTISTTVHYTLWRMLREPGLRAGVGCYNQTYANKVSRMIRRLMTRGAARMATNAGLTRRQDEWEMANGSTFIARGVGSGIAGHPVDLFVIDDPFKNRKEADSVVVQERVYEWYMDDVTPRIQKGGAVVLIHTRWNAGDLIGRIRRSEEADEWRYVTLKAIAEEDDPLKRAPGSALCEDRFPLAKLEQKRRTEGVGFESLYQQNEVPRGGSFFERDWFNRVVSHVPEADDVRRLRYWDLGGSKKRETTAWTAGVLLARDRDYWYVEDVVRGRWPPPERNQVIRNVAAADAHRQGFRKTYFEQQPGVAGEETTQNLIRALAGFPAEGDKVTGDKLVRAVPFADACRVGLVRLVAGPWNAAYLGELEAVPNGPWMDQCDSSSGAFNCHARLPWGEPSSERFPEPQQQFDRPPPQVIDYAATHNLFGMGQS